MQWSCITRERRRTQELCVLREFASFHPRIAQTCPTSTVPKQKNEDITPHPQLNVCNTQILAVWPEIVIFPEMGPAGGSLDVALETAAARGHVLTLDHLC